MTLRANYCEIRLKLIRCILPLGAIFFAQAAVAGDAENGKRFAQLRCGACHIVVPNQREEVADAPPFELIARKFGSNVELLTAALISPHSKMNLTFARREAEDIAAYITTLAK